MFLVKTALLQILHALVFGAALIFGSVAAAAGEGQALPQSQEDILYDIPSQGLASALKAYAAASGVQVLYETALTADRRSADVKGAFTPDAALQTLLAGSGLVSRRTDIDAITLVPTSRSQAGNIVPDARFLGALQTGILTALCRRDETRPGVYRMALQLWIMPDGIIQRAVLLSSTGNERRDRALADALRNAPVGVMPPIGMPQPVTMTIEPRSRPNDECRGG